MTKKRIFALIVAVVMALGIAGCGADSNKVTPTFMYFVSGSDADFDKTNAMLDELKAEYENDIVFNIVNIDEDKEAAKNFPVEGNTPALIMLNEANDISAIEFKCSDKEKLTSDIKAALGEE